MCVLSNFWPPQHNLGAHKVRKGLNANQSQNEHLENGTSRHAVLIL